MVDESPREPVSVVADGGLPVPRLLERAAYADREEWLESSRFTVDLLARVVGRDDLSEIELLDIGCGTKVVKRLLDDSLPIGHYTGIDVSSDVIDWLKANVSDPRFEFHHFDAHNDLYNPQGTPLAGFDLLPTGPARYDLISLFSVFTHLAPDDFVAMLRLLRRHIKPEGTLLFSLYLAEADRPSPLVDAVRDGLNSDDPEVRARMAEAVEEARRHSEAAGHDPRFSDEIPGQPLMVARYQRDYALELFNGTGWEIESIHPPERYIQHYIVCHPA
jgi:SAM-dependent methyltransferase